MDDRQKQEQRDTRREDPQSAELEDLQVTPEDAAEVKGGGKVHMQDFNFVKRTDKSSP